MTTPGGRTHRRRQRSAARLPPQVPMLAVLLIAGLGFVRILAEHWRQGTTLIGASLLVAAIIRALLPGDRAGLLAVRSQAIDVMCYLILGVLVVALASTVPRLPFVLQ